MDRLYEFADPRKIVTAAEGELRERCRSLSETGMRFDFFLAFPEEERSLTEKFQSAEHPSWWKLKLIHLYLRMFAWERSSIRGCVQLDELDSFWEYMDLKDEEPSVGEKEAALDSLVEAGLWNRHDEVELWCYELCRNFIAQSWLAANQVIGTLSDVVDDSKAEALWKE